MTTIDAAFLARWGVAWGDPDVAGLLELYSPQARYRDVGSDITCVGHDQLARFHEFMLTFAPDSKITFTEAHGDATGFAALWDWGGTATSPLRVKDEVFAVSGGCFTVSGVAYCTLAEDGLIASHEDYYDMFDVLRQVRADASPGAAS